MIRNSERLWKVEEAETLLFQLCSILFAVHDDHSFCCHCIHGAYATRGRCLQVTNNNNNKKPLCCFSLFFYSWCAQSWWSLMAFSNRSESLFLFGAKCLICCSDQNYFRWSFHYIYTLWSQCVELKFGKIVSIILKKQKKKTNNFLALRRIRKRIFFFFFYFIFFCHSFYAAESADFPGLYL